eukprot:3958421-Prymnesium_polylepis.1
MPVPLPVLPTFGLSLVFQVTRLTDHDFAVELLPPVMFEPVLLDGISSRQLKQQSDAIAQHQHLLYTTKWLLKLPVQASTPSLDLGLILVLAQDARTPSCELLSTSLHLGLSTPVNELLRRLETVTFVILVSAATVQSGQQQVNPLFAVEVALGLLHVQRSSDSTPNTWLLTTGVQAAANEPSTVSLHSHAGSWGLARSARAEAHLAVRCTDVPRNLVGWLLSCEFPETELETITLSNDRSCASRLIRFSSQQSTTSLSIVGRHIVTGGTAGLGLLTARWLAQSGALSLVLASRSGSFAGNMDNELLEMRESASVVTREACDTGALSHVRRLVCNAQSIQLVGVWHAAGVLADATLGNQSAHTMAFVFAPKAYGAWALHLAYSSLCLRACVCFSSAAALLGGIGQANYSAANTCLDALCTRKCVNGHAAASVQWGAWAEVGMASRGSAKDRMVMMEASKGFASMTLAQGLSGLHVAILPSALPVLAVMNIDWRRFVANETPVPALLSNIVSPSLDRISIPTLSGQEFAEQAKALKKPRFSSDLSKRKSLHNSRRSSVNSIKRDSLSEGECLELVRTASRRYSHTLSVGSADDNTPLMEAGLDSLSIVELRNDLQAAAPSTHIPSTIVFDHPTTRQLALALLRLSETETMPASETRVASTES